MVLSWPSPEKKLVIKNAANIFISFIGAGVLGLPYAFKKAGLLEGNYLIFHLFGKKIKDGVYLTCRHNLI